MRFDWFLRWPRMTAGHSRTENLDPSGTVSRRDISPREELALKAVKKRASMIVVMDRLVSL